MTRRLPIDWRLVPVALVTLAATIGVLLAGPIHQPAEYHAFADQRSLFGVPHFADTISNLPFLLIGIAGIISLRTSVPPGGHRALRPAYLLFFVGTALLFPGSGYYHLWPSNATLTWDRLPMSIAFMAFVAVVVGEHLRPQLGRHLLVPLVVLGVASVAWWRVTDSGDGGDLRLYILVQYLPMVLIPLIAFVYPATLRPTSHLWALLVCYALAKALELLDGPVFALFGVISGHSLKHLVAALGIGFFLVGLHRRRSVQEKQT